MIEYSTYLLLAFFSLTAIMLFVFVVYSYIEREQKAFKRGVFVFILFAIICIALASVKLTFSPYFLLFIGLVLTIVLLKFGNKKVEFEIPEKRYDERDVMFSRNTLLENTEKFDAYYKMRPEHKPADDAFRKEAGLMRKGASLYNELLFNAADATFKTVDLLQAMVENTASAEKSTLPEKAIAGFIRNWTIKLGAEDVAFTNIKPHHKYTHVGRGDDYGNEVRLDHEYAIAFTVEMSHESLSYNPKGPVVMESAQQYLNAGQIAVQLAEFLRSLGYEARAHIDANYRLICPIVAQDAGLGTIGRMGLLMTPKLGPRVRIGVVSTNLELPLNENGKSVDYSAVHFCEVCKKCANNCPSQAIPNHSYSINGKTEPWKINHEKCFTLWCKVGTDCGRCVAVCPYSHPDNLVHNIIRWMIKRNPVNRWLALKLDDFFYGRKPAANKLKSWMNP